MTSNDQSKNAVNRGRIEQRPLDAVETNGSSRIAATIILVLLASFLPQTDILPTIAGWFIVACLYAFLCVTLVVSEEEVSIKFPRIAIYLLAPIWLTYLIHIAIIPAQGESVSIEMFARPFVFISISIVNIFLIPYKISSRSFYSAILGISTLMIILWSPGIVSNATFPIYDLSSSGSIHLFGKNLYKLSYIFRNPNAGGYFTMVAVVVAFTRVLKNRNPWLLAILGINVFGLFMTKSRGSYLGAIAGIIFVATLLLSGPAIARLALIASATVCSAIVAMFANVFPEPTHLALIDLSGRREIWAGAIEAIVHQPLGYGPKPARTILKSFISGGYSGAGIHNSYLRMFLTTGIIGGIAYWGFVLVSIYRAIRKNATVSELVILGVVVAISIEEIFEGNSFFGLSMASLIWSVSIGFALEK